MTYICRLTDKDVEKVCSYLYKRYTNTRALIFDEDTESSSFKDVSDKNYDRLIKDATVIAMEFTSNTANAGCLTVDTLNDMVAIDTISEDVVKELIQELHLDVVRMLKDK